MAAQREKTGLDIEAAVSGAGQILKLADEVDVLGGDADKLREQTRGLVTELDRLAAQQQTITTFERTTAAAAATSEQIGKLSAQSSEAAARQQQLQSNLSAAQQVLNTQRAAVADLTSQQQRANVTLTEAEAKYRDLQAQARAAGKGNETLQQSVVDARAEFDRARTSVQELNGNVREATRVQGELERAVKSDEQAISRQAKAITDLDSKLDRARASQQEQNETLQRAGDNLRRAGLDTNNLGAAQSRLRASTIVANTAIAQSRAELESQRAALKRSADETNRTGEALDRLGGRAKAAIGAYVGIQTARELIAVADAAQLVESRLRLVTDSEAELTQAQTGLLDIAQRTRQSYEGTAELFTTIARSADSLNLSQQRLLGITETIQQATKVSGAGAASAQAALTQLGQGLASGTLRGEELNSILEQTPRIAQALADGLGVPIGKLRELGKEGELTAEKVIGALESQGAAVRAEFEKLAPTVADTITTTKNSFQQFIAELNKQTGATSGIGAVVAGIGGIFESLAINLELARKEAESQKLVLFEVGSVARESETRIRKFAEAQGEATGTSSSLTASIVALKQGVADLGKDIEKADNGKLNELAAKAQRAYAEASSELESLKARFPDLEAVSESTAATLREGFDAAAERVREAGSVIEALRNEQLRRLGVDGAAVLTGIDAKARDALETFKSLASDPTAQPKLITASFKELLKTLDSREELESARVALRKAFDDGRVSAKDLADGIGEVNGKLAQIPGTAEATAAALVASSKAATQALIADADARLAREKARGVADVDTHKEVETEKVEATEASAERQIEANASVAKFVADNLAKIRGDFALLSEEAGRSFDAIVNKASKASLIFFFEDIVRGTEALRRVQERQTAQAESLTRQLTDQHNATIGLIRTAEDAAGAFEFVDSQRLDSLNAAIEGARSRLRGLRDDAASTVAALRDELDRLRGNEEAIEQRRRDAQRVDLQQQLSQAQALGDKDAIAALRSGLQILAEIEKTRADQIRAEGGTPQTPAPTRQSNEPSRKLRLELALPGGNSITGDFDADQTTRTLEELARYQAVAGR